MAFGCRSRRAASSTRKHQGVAASRRIGYPQVSRAADTSEGDSARSARVDTLSSTRNTRLSNSAFRVDEGKGLEVRGL